MEQKAAIVTGATRGIGLGITRRLLGEGWAVMGTGTGTAEAYRADIATLSSLGTFVYQRCDISNEQDRSALVHQAVTQFGRIDALINNAGVAPKERADLLELTGESFDYVMGINLRGTFFLTQACSREMLRLQAEGLDAAPVIVIISSLSAYTASINRGEYCISKAGLAQVTQLFADRLSQHGINVYEIRPGIIRTDMTAKVTEKYNGLIQGGLLPLQRWGTPDDVASAVWAICSGLLPYSTGEVINVDGGFHMRRL